MMKLIKTEQDHREALEQIERLMTAGDSPDVLDQLELLAHLVEKYEEEQFPIDFPTPVEAIKFRMEQQGLNQSDLVKYIGSKSKVSEVLNNKRPLTLEMMRKLNRGLGISPEVLLQEPKAEFPDSYSSLEWNLFPLKELAKKSIIESKNCTDKAEECIRGLLQDAGLPPLLNSCHRQSSWNGKPADWYATFAWELIVRAKARKIDLPVKYVSGAFNEEHMARLAHLSIYDNGPLLAQEYLAKHGIVLVIESALKGTYLDGIAMFLDKGTPVVGLTLRLDRIDYFWFTLMHELAHIVKHLDSHNSCIVDFRDSCSAPSADIETEANQIARSVLIPENMWLGSEAKRYGSKAGAIALARKLEIHEAIVAGRIRKERNNYRILHQLVGNKKVRKLFLE
ncbi:helix-turn-helix domain-containing protein [Maridesulfovibrio sp.]|uniref:helix-turn-helix domain-containing protein n=1 Tax=Maridesulfovibrio sp. TaxID=2795000 RepID=UPI0029CA92B6|nr:helix-turn-helix domain-containing protein [Maridesulfovibrio sp.]